MNNKPSRKAKQGDTDDQTLLVRLVDKHAANAPYAGAAQYQLPLMCACCLKPTAARVTLRWGEQHNNTIGAERVTVTRSAAMSIFVCEECQAHEKEYLRKRTLLLRLTIILSSLVSGALLYYYSAWFDQFNHIAAYLGMFGLMTIFVALFFIILLDLILHLGGLGRQHASRTRGVIMHSPNQFEFDNLEYGRAFAQANKQRFQIELKRRQTYFTNKVHGRSMLEGKPLATILSIGLPVSLAVTLVQTFLAGVLNVGVFHAQDGLWYRAILWGMVYVMVLITGQKYSPPHRKERDPQSMDDVESV